MNVEDSIIIPVRWFSDMKRDSSSSSELYTL